MFGKQRRELDPPPIAKSSENAVEVLRVWAQPGHPQQLTLKTTWKNPAAWGLLVVDVARHAAKAYAAEGQDYDQVLARIVEMMQAELAKPTDIPQAL